MSPQEREQRVRTAFQKELNLIADPDLREFVVRAAGRLCQDSFWERPTSLTKKHHPKVMNKEPGGLVNHTRYAVMLGVHFCRMHGDGSENANAVSPHQDIVVGALILHDMMKDGPTRESVSTHGVDLANAIVRAFFPDGRGMSQKHMLLLYGVACHMGRWTEPKQYRPQNIQDPLCRHVAEVVHLADMAAACKVDTFLEQLA